MADHFEKAKDEILKRTAGNGGPQPLDILTALGALADDQDEQHAESMEEVRKNRSLLGTHVAEATVRDERITVLEEWRHEQVATCEDRVRRLIKDEHAVRHDAYVASLSESGFNNRLMWFFATAIGRVALFVLGALAMLAVNLLVYGRP